MKKTVPLLEVAAALVLLYFLYPFMQNTNLDGWQQSVFGAAPLTSSLLFFVLPVLFVLAARRKPGASGFSTQRLAYHLRVAMTAVAVIVPVTMLFPVVVVLGLDPRQWAGAAILTAGFAAGGLVMARLVRGLANEAEPSGGLDALLGYAGALAAGLVLVALLNRYSELAARIVYVLVFVAFLEENFFRGYVQSRLNEIFGRPYRFQGVGFGAGLPIAAAAFGLMHPLLAPGEPTPWAWALWTATGGLVFGFLREKTGAVIAPALVHGAILVPGVLFGSV